MEKRKQIEKVKKRNDKNRLICDLALGKITTIEKGKKTILQRKICVSYKVQAIKSTR